MANPTLVKNRAGQLHNLDGPAFDDGCVQIWYINGVIHRDDGPAWREIRTPENDRYIINGVGLAEAGEEIAKRIVMDPGSLTVAEVKNIANLEIKRIAIDRMGAERFLTESGAKVIDQRNNDVEGTKEALLKLDDRVVYLDRKSTRLNSSHITRSRMPSSA